VGSGHQVYVSCHVDGFNPDDISLRFSPAIRLHYFIEFHAEPVQILLISSFTPIASWCCLAPAITPWTHWTANNSLEELPSTYNITQSHIQAMRRVLGSS
jgi:hypothetical protein